MPGSSFGGQCLTAVNPAIPSAEKKAMIEGAIVDMKHYLRAVIDARRLEPKEDMVSDLIRAEADGHRLTDDDIMAFLFLLLPAGFETTTNLIANAMVVLLNHRSNFIAFY